MTNLLTILTVRNASERLPGKALAEIKSRVPGQSRKVSAPLVVWIARRLRQMGTPLIATTNDPTDNELTNVLQAEGFRVIRGSVTSSPYKGALADPLNDGNTLRPSCVPAIPRNSIT